MTAFAVVDCLTDVYSSVLTKLLATFVTLPNPPIHPLPLSPYTLHAYTLHDRMCACHLHSRGCYHVKQQCIFLVYCGHIYFNVLKPLCTNILIVFIMPIAESSSRVCVPSFLCRIGPCKAVHPVRTYVRTYVWSVETEQLRLLPQVVLQQRCHFSVAKLHLCAFH